MRPVEDALLASVRAHRLAHQWPLEIWEVLFAALWEEYREQVTPRRAALFARHLRQALWACAFDEVVARLATPLNAGRSRTPRGRPRGSGRISKALVFGCYWFLLDRLQRRRPGTSALASLRAAWATLEPLAQGRPVPFPEREAAEALKAAEARKRQRPQPETIEQILAAAFKLEVETVHRYRMLARRGIPDSALRALGIRHRSRRATPHTE